MLRAFLVTGLIASSAFALCTQRVGGHEGECAADFRLKSLDGKEISLSSLRGKVVFLNFWATWCEPCKVEVPYLEKVYHAMEKENFVLLSVSIDSEGKKAIDSFWGNRNAPFPVLLDSDQKVSRQYGTFKVPETYIIDREGNIRDKIEGIREWSDPMLIHYFKLLSQM